MRYRQIEQIQRIGLITQCAAEKQATAIAFIDTVLREHIFRTRYKIFPHVGRFRFRTVVMVITDIAGESEFPVLQCQISVSSISAIGVTIGSHRSGVTVVYSLVGDDIDDAAYSLGIVFCTRIGNHFDVFDAVRRHALEYLRRIVRNHVRRFAVKINLKIGRSFQLNVVFGVNRHHRHFTQQVEHIGCGCFGIIFGVIGEFVDLDLH